MGRYALHINSDMVVSKFSMGVIVFWNIYHALWSGNYCCRFMTNLT